VEADVFVQITRSEFSPALRVTTVLGGFVASMVGRLIIKLLFGALGLAILGGATWWLLAKD